MWGRRNNQTDAQAAARPLQQAMRDVRNEVAERSGVVVDLRDAEQARLELLNEALDPLFADVPSYIELFDRGVSRGDLPRLWIDVIAHVEMGRDKRQYRFVQETRYGRATLAESHEIAEIVRAVTRYVARRLLERERALSDDAPFGRASAEKILELEQRRGRLRAVRTFIYGAVVAVGVLFTLAILNGPRP